MKSSVKKRAIFVCGEKGGVGKSTFSRGLLQLYRDAGMQVAAYDADGNVGQLLQFYGTRGADGRLVQDQDPQVGVDYFDIHSDREREILIEAIETGAETILMDLPGGSLHELTKVLNSGQELFKAYADHGYEVVVCIVISYIKASVRSVLDAVKDFGDTAKYVVVKNLGVGGNPTPEDFDFYDGFEEDGQQKFGAARRAVEKFGGRTILMPALQAETYRKVDQGDLSFGEAREQLTVGHKYRMNIWLRDLGAQLAEGGLAALADDEVSAA